MQRNYCPANQIYKGMKHLNLDFLLKYLTSHKKSPSLSLSVNHIILYVHRSTSYGRENCYKISEYVGRVIILILQVV
jgi:hypothetical protein